MTREEAKKIMETIKADCYIISTDEDKHAFNMAIKALEWIDVLNKIRAEIEQAKTYTCKTEDGKEFTVSADSIVHPDDRFYTRGLDKALDIIDKCRTESEINNG